VNARGMGVEDYVHECLGGFGARARGRASVGGWTFVARGSAGTRGTARGTALRASRDGARTLGCGGRDDDGGSSSVFALGCGVAGRGTAWTSSGRARSLRGGDDGCLWDGGGARGSHVDDGRGKAWIRLAWSEMDVEMMEASFDALACAVGYRLTCVVSFRSQRALVPAFRRRDSGKRERGRSIAEGAMTAAKSRSNRGNNQHHDVERKETHAEATTKGPTVSRNVAVDATAEGKRTPDNELVSTLGKVRPVPASSSESDEEAMMVKRAKKNWSADAVALGYEVGTIKHSAYVLLAESGTAGMTVASIVGTAQRLSMYSWGQCKTPNNSVTAALSQDETFVRIAPSTYCLRSQLCGDNLPAPRTSSGSHDSGTTGLGRHGDSGQSGHHARNHKKQRTSAHAPRQRPPMQFVVDGPSYSGYDDDDVVDVRVDDSFDRYDRAVDANKTAQALAQESYRRRMDVYGHNVGDDFGSSFHFPPQEIVRPNHSPEAAVAGSCLLYYPTARTVERLEIAESPEEPSEATCRAASWRNEAKRLHTSKHKSPPRVSTLPMWVLEQYLEKHNQILSDDL